MRPSSTMKLVLQVSLIACVLSGAIQPGGRVPADDERLQSRRDTTSRDDRLKRATAELGLLGVFGLRSRPRPSSEARYRVPEPMLRLYDEQRSGKMSLVSSLGGVVRSFYDQGEISTDELCVFVVSSFLCCRCLSIFCGGGI
jgi:hypothetical protein